MNEGVGAKSVFVHEFGAWAGGAELVEGDDGAVVAGPAVPAKRGGGFDGDSGERAEHLSPVFGRLLFK